MTDIQTLFDSDEAENEYMKEQEARRLKAEEKKQIEEMARHIPARIFAYDVSENSAKLDEKHREIVAAHLYRAGYRQLRTAQWVTIAETEGGLIVRYTYRCTDCNYFYKTVCPRGDDYCHKCGAKMRGAMT